MSSNEDKYTRQLTRLGKRQATREEQIWFGRYNALRRSVNEMKKEIRLLKSGKNIVASSPTVIIAPTVAHSDTTGKTIDDHHNKLHTVEHQVGGNDRIVALDFFNSSFQEQFNFTVTSNGTVITGSLEKTGTGDLTMQFANQALVILDCSPALTVTITPGTDTVPVYRYYYVLESAPTIITEGTDWPSAEHVPVAKLNVPSAVFAQTKNVYSNQNINNMRAMVAGDLSGMGRHLGHKIRESIGATYKSVGGGLAGAAGGGEYLDVSGGTTVRFKMDAGVLMQMHDHTFNAVDTNAGDVVLVRNFSGTAWNDISNIYDIVNDNLGASINNKYFNIIVVAIASKETDYVMINTPGGSYSTLAKAVEDKDRFDDYTIPIEFKGVSTLICRMVIRKAASAWVVHQIDDLRGTNPAVLSGAPVTGGYSDTDVEAYVNSVANAGIATGDSVVFTDVNDGGALKQDLVSDLLALAGSPSGLVTQHSDVSNAGSGIIISAAERTALHSRYLDSEAIDAVEAVSQSAPVASDSIVYTDAGVLKRVFFSSVDEDVLTAIKSYVDTHANDMVGAANGAWIPCEVIDSHLPATAHYDFGANMMRNNSSTNFAMFFSLPKERINGAGLNLHVGGIRITLADADNGDFPSAFQIYAPTSSGLGTAIYEDLATTCYPAGDYEDGVSGSLVAWGTADDVSAAKSVWVIITFTATNNADCDFFPPELFCYYE